MTIRQLSKAATMGAIPVGLTWARKFGGGWKAFLHLQWGPRIVAERPTSPRLRHFIVKVETRPVRVSFATRPYTELQPVLPIPDVDLSHPDFSPLSR